MQAPARRVNEDVCIRDHHQGPPARVAAARGQEVRADRQPRRDADGRTARPMVAGIICFVGPAPLHRLAFDGDRLDPVLVVFPLRVARQIDLVERQLDPLGVPPSQENLLLGIGQERLRRAHVAEVAVISVMACSASSTNSLSDFACSATSRR